MSKFVIISLFVAMFFLLAGCKRPRLGNLISQTYPLPETSISAFGPVGVTFSEPMDQKSVEESFSLSPPVEGDLSWEGNTLWFRPLQPYEQNSGYRADLSGTFKTRDGQVLIVDESWQFSIRQAEFIFLRDGEIWRSTQYGSGQRQLSSSDRLVLEFSADRSGECIVYAIQNILGGQNIWIMDRDGKNNRMLVDCGQDRCAEPAWSTDRHWIAYTRESTIKDSGGYSPARVWKADIETGETQLLYQNDEVYGQSPSFSPDGKHLASYDANHSGISVLDLQTFKVFFIPRTIQGTGDWSQDGQKIIYTDLVSTTFEQSVLIYIVDLNTGEISQPFGEEISGTDFSEPKWIPGGDWIAASLRPFNDVGNKALWIIRLNDTFAIPVSDAPSATFSAYRWDPWGEKLVFQSLKLSSSDPSTSIWLWNWETRKAVLIIQEGFRPAWLP